jgi:hypothetical protein
MFLVFETQLLKSLRGHLQIFLCSIFSKTEFLFIGLPKQLSKIENPYLSMTHTVTYHPFHLLEIWALYLTLTCLYIITFLPS